MPTTFLRIYPITDVPRDIAWWEEKTAWDTNEFDLYDLNGNAVFFF